MVSRVFALLSALVILSASCGEHASETIEVGPATAGEDPATALDAAAPSLFVSGRSNEVVVLGDSLSNESFFELHLALLLGGYQPTVGAIGGSAPCDWLPELERELAESDPAVVVLEFAGNNMTACTLDSAGLRRTGAEKLAMYERDVGALVELALADGAQVLLIGPPDMDPEKSTHESNLLDALYQQMAEASDAVWYADLSDALSPDGVFTPTAPCLDIEASRPECVDGQIPIRNPDGVHLCATGEYEAINVAVGRCTAYSSGATRLALLVVESLRELRSASQ